jgi:TonB family protein
MRSLFQYLSSTTRFRRAVLLMVLSLMALSSSPVPSHPIHAEDIITMTPWAASFDGENESNIEKYSIAQVQPPYPVAAQRYRIQGVVTVQVAVNKDGKVLKADFVKGHTVFKTVSLEAARQWQFESPTGKDIEGTIDFTFKLK